MKVKFPRAKTKMWEGMSERDIFDELKVNSLAIDALKANKTTLELRDEVRELLNRDEEQTKKEIVFSFSQEIIDGILSKSKQIQKDLEKEEIDVSAEGLNEKFKGLVVEAAHLVSDSFSEFTFTMSDEKNFQDIGIGRMFNEIIGTYVYPSRGRKIKDDKRVRAINGAIIKILMSSMNYALDDGMFSLVDFKKEVDELSKKHPNLKKRKGSPNQQMVPYNDRVALAPNTQNYMSPYNDPVGFRARIVAQTAEAIGNGPTIEQLKQTEVGVAANIFLREVLVGMYKRWSPDVWDRLFGEDDNAESGEIWKYLEEKERMNHSKKQKV